MQSFCDIKKKINKKFKKSFRIEVKQSNRVEKKKLISELPTENISLNRYEKKKTILPKSLKPLDQNFQQKKIKNMAIFCGQYA